MKKRIVFLIMLIFLFLLALSGSKQEKQKVTATQKVLNIYCWNDEFKSRVEAYYPDYDKKTHQIGEVKVKWIIIPNENNAYQSALDEALANQKKAAENDKVDIFLLEADYAQKYINVKDSVAMNIFDLGLTKEDLNEQFSYTCDVVTDTSGIQRGISWQACPGLMIYRRDIAKEVLGTDNPKQVQQMVKNWKCFDDVAEKMAQKGKKMVSGYDDTYRVFMNNCTSAWVNTKNEIVVDEAMWDWVKQTKNYSVKGYNDSYGLFSQNWGENAKKNTFCYFGPAWLIDYSLTNYSLEIPLINGGRKEEGNGTYGKWAACIGPESYFWGGTWMCGAIGTDNSEVIADMMRTLCCNEDTALALAKDVNDFSNHQSAMRILMKDETYGSKFLGGQNIYGLLYQSANNIVMDKCTGYDQGINEKFQLAFHSYFDGKKDLKGAYDNFQAMILEKYPELKMEKK